MILNRFFKSLTRKKVVLDTGGSQLARVLTLLDLTALGVGSTLGLGVYVLAGTVAKQLAGPAVCISFLVAAIASAVAGLCYAEFAARVPKAGSAYVYSYVSVGEFVAFIIGWNLILEYGLGTASVAKALSSYIDVLTDKEIESEQSTWIKMDVNFLSTYVDFLSFGFVALLTVLLSIGVKESTRLNNILTGLNLITISIMLVSGIINADIHNWQIPKEDIPANYTEDAGEGGFAPFGVSGIMAGAAKCFYGFVGFDVVATTGEEAINPQRNIPLSITISLVIIFLSYFGISSVLTLMWPYYLQDEDAPFPYVFGELGWETIKLIVTVGAIFALFTSLLGAMFPLPRVIYAMSNDGLIFKFMEKINAKTKTPILATIISGILAGAMAAFFDLQQLIDMMSIGTLTAYTIVAVCVLLLRYEPDIDDKKYPPQIKQDLDVDGAIKSFVKLIFNLNGNKYPNETTSLITNYSIAIFSVLAIGMDAFTIYGLDDLLEPYWLVIFNLIILLMIAVFVIIARQPVNTTVLTFKVPWVPLLPLFSIIMNLYLMLQLSVDTWKNFSVWLALGFLIYFVYGIRKSRNRSGYKKKSPVVTSEVVVADDLSIKEEFRYSQQEDTTKF